MKHIKQVLCILLALLLSFATVYPCAAANDHTVEPGTTASPLNILDPQLWVGNDAVLHITSRPTETTNALYVFARDKGSTTLSISAALDEPLDLSSMQELAFTMHISGSGICDFTVTFLCKGVYYNASAKISAGGEPTVYIPIPDKAKGQIDALALTLGRQEEPIKSFFVLSANGDTRFSYAHTTRFMSAGFEPISGTMREQEDCVFVTPKNGTASFYPHYLTDKKNTIGNAAVYLRVRSTQAAGTIAAQGVTSTAPMTLLSGEHTYAFLINGSYSDLEFVFTGISATQDAPLTITGAAIQLFPESLSDGVGTITSCRSDGKNVTVKGSIPSDTVVSYINCELALYVIPVWADEAAILKEAPAAKMSISTRFELSIPINESDGLCKYKVMILSEQNKISVAPSVFLNNGGTISPSESYVTGIHGANAADIFESNVSNVMIDVYANRMLETEDIYTALLYASGNTHFYFNCSYIAELDAQIQFCRSSGTKVYIRLLTSETDAFAYTAKDSESILQLHALITFLAQRYQGVTGFIMGAGVNADHYDNIENFANLAAIFTESVQKNCPGATTVIPVQDTYADSAAEGIAPSDPIGFLCQLLAHLTKYKSGSIMILYESRSRPQSAVAETVHVSALVTACGHLCDGSILFWQPNAGDTDNTKEIYKNVCIDAARAGLRSVILSVSKLNTSDALFNGIKEAIFENTSATLHRRPAEKDSVSKSLAIYPLWDFTASYDTGGWVAGGGFRNTISADAKNQPGRVLQARMNDFENQAGILLCRMETPLDLSDINIEFSFDIYNINTQDTDLSIIFGSGDSRAEYSLSLEESGAFTATCNLKDFPDASHIDYVAIILRSTSTPILEVAKINMCSNQKNTEQLQRIAEGAPKEPDPIHPVYYFTIVVLSAATIAIFSLLGRKHSKSSQQHRR